MFVDICCTARYNSCSLLLCMFAVQKSCIHTSAVAVFVEWWIVTVQDLCYSLYNRWSLL